MLTRADDNDFHKSKKKYFLEYIKLCCIIIDDQNDRDKSIPIKK